MSATVSEAESRNEVLAAVRTLARAAGIFRDAFVQAVEGLPASQILDTWGDALVMADEVINHWASHLGLDAEAPPDGPNGAGDPGRGTKRSGPGRRKATRSGRRPGPPT
jgi:hypothetical protein